MLKLLKPTIDRLDYGKLLSPPPGYETAAAVGTTYSLDMDALIGICIALGLSESTDGELRDNPIYLLDVLRKTADKVVVFCEGGQTKAPANMSSLYILLEKIVFEVNLPNKKSFHPKFWLVKYENKDKDVIYRCVVLSRNLTFDRSWDVALSFEGIKGGATTEKSTPLRDLLRYLKRYTPKSDINGFPKRKLLNSFSDEVANVSFSLKDKRFPDFEIWPVGIPRSDIDGIYNIKDAGLFHKYKELLIVSPFISGGIIEDFNKLALKDAGRTLITRKSELKKLKPEAVDGIDIYTMKDAIVDGEDSFTEDAEEKQRQDIHAKLYLKTKYSESDLYLGSLNASHSACHGNVEFVIKLSGKRRYLNVDILKNDIFGGEPDNMDNPFELTELPGYMDPTPEPSDLLQKQIKEVCRARSSASVSEQDGKYNITVAFDKLPPMDRVSISPLLSNKEKPVDSSVEFTGLDLLQLSEFYVVRAENDEDIVCRVIKITTGNMPELRENALVNSIIKDRRSFIQYIVFLLGDNYLLSLLENKEMQTPGFAPWKGEQIPALYEKMLKTAASAPERFDEIDYLLRMITDEEIIPDGFAGLYDTFKKAVKKK